MYFFLSGYMQIQVDDKIICLYLKLKGFFLNFPKFFFFLNTATNFQQNISKHISFLYKAEKSEEGKDQLMNWNVP